MTFNVLHSLSETCSSPHWCWCRCHSTVCHSVDVEVPPSGRDSDRQLVSTSWYEVGGFIPCSGWTFPQMTSYIRTLYDFTGLVLTSYFDWTGFLSGCGPRVEESGCILLLSNSKMGQMLRMYYLPVGTGNACFALFWQHDSSLHQLAALITFWCSELVQTQLISRRYSGLVSAPAPLPRWQLLACVLSELLPASDVQPLWGGGQMQYPHFYEKKHKTNINIHVWILYCRDSHEVHHAPKPHLPVGCVHKKRRRRG